MPTIRTAVSKGAKLTPTEADSNMKRSPVAKTSDYTLDATHNREFHELGGTVSTVTLPVFSSSFSETDDWEVTLKNTLSTSVTVARGTGQTIEGAASNFTLPANGSATFVMNSSFNGSYVKNLGASSALGTMATQSASAVAITGGTISGITDLTAVGDVTPTAVTYVDFTGIPSWVRRITVVCNGISTDGTSPFKLLLGDSGGLATTGYFATYGYYSSSAQSASSATIGFVATRGPAANTSSQIWTLINITANQWVVSMTGEDSGGSIIHSAGAKTLTGTLTQLRYTTVGGTDTFDNGTINVFYE